MTDKTREDFENYLDGSVTDTHGKYIGDAFDLWQAATLAEREKCALVCDDRVYALDHAGKQYRREWTASQCAAAIRQGGAS